jgi:hypothetical protein
MRPVKRRLPELIIFTTLLVCYAYFFPRWADWNQNSRLDQVLAIVDRGVWTIDDYYQNTGDYAQFQGHIYSDKAPGTAFAGVPAYAVFKVLSGPFLNPLIARLQNSSAFQATLREGGTGLLADKVRLAIVLNWLTFVCVSLPAALLGVVLYRFLGRFTTVELYRISTTLVYGLGTIAFTYSGEFMSHQLVAILLFVGFYLLANVSASEQSRARLLAAGLLLGMGVITEYETSVVAAVIVLYGWHRLPHKWQTLWIVLGGVWPGLLAAGYNLSIFHTPLPVAYHYSVLFPEHFQGGIMGFSVPRLAALWGMSLSPFRGLFFVSPVLLLSLVGLAVWFQQRTYLAEALVIAVSAALYFLLIASSEVWPGGFSVGPRYLCVLLPFLAVPLVFFLERFGRFRWGYLLFSLLALISIAVVWIETISGQQFPEYTPNPLFDYSLPRLMANDVARNMGMLLRLSGWQSLLPLAAFILLQGAAVWLLTLKTKAASLPA